MGKGDDVETREFARGPVPSPLEALLAGKSPFDASSLGNAYPEFTQMRHCTQDPSWHAEGDVMTHTQMALEVLWSELPASSPRWQDMTLTVLLHDIGKPAVHGVNKETGKVTAYEHELAGVPIARELLRDLGYNGPARDQILQLIAWHMRPREIQEVSSKDLAFIRLALEVPMENLLTLLHADRIGRKADDLVANWEMTKEHFHKRVDQLGLHEPFFLLTQAERELLNVGPEKLSWITGVLAYETWQGWIRNHPAALSRAYDLTKEQPRGTFYLTAGAPGSGKSSWAKKAGYPIVSTDAIRQTHKLDLNSKEDTQRVYPLAKEELKRLFGEGQEVLIFDATNLDPHRRVNFIEMARRYQYRIVGVSTDIPLDTALRQNKARDAKVPEEVVRRYHSQLLPFSSYEADLVLRPYELDK